MKLTFLGNADQFEAAATGSVFLWHCQTYTYLKLDKAELMEYLRKGDNWVIVGNSGMPMAGTFYIDELKFKK